MPNVPPGAPTGAPGTVTNFNQYPQWGVGGGTPGSTKGWKIVEAQNAAQKTSYASQGYAVWFTSQKAAQSFVTEEESPFASGEPQGAVENAIPGLVQIGDFFGALTSANTWIRAAKVIVGGTLLIIGIAHMTGSDQAVAQVARKVPLPI